MSQLHRDEQEIRGAFEAGLLQQAPDSDKRQARHQHSAVAMCRKDARINIRLASKNLRDLREDP